MKFKFGVNHKQGDRRTIRFFAWLPTHDCEDVLVWLEWVTAEQLYLGSGIGGSWFNIKFVKGIDDVKS